jgi:hypothetical protein
VFALRVGAVPQGREFGERGRRLGGRDGARDGVEECAEELHWAVDGAGVGVRR